MAKAKKQKQTKPLAERLEMEAAKAALEKRRRGETLKRGEISAINRYERLREADLRVQYLSDCPQGTVEEMFGISRKTLMVLKNEGLPFRLAGRRLSFNLYEVGCWLWGRFRSRGALDKHGGSGSSPALERLREKTFERREWELERDRGGWLEKSEVMANERDMALAFRQACEMAGRALAPRLDGLSVQQRQKLIDDYFGKKLRELSGTK